jgi:hypothetical protein
VRQLTSHERRQKLAGKNGDVHQPEEKWRPWKFIFIYNLVFWLILYLFQVLL